MAIDPVCKMEVSPESAAASLEWQGETFYFCSDNCRNTFEVSPEYLGG